MAFYRQHPELLVGGGSTLGSLGTAPAALVARLALARSRRAPVGGGPAQQIPAYPDASRYAGVSPQGGGPIPPDVMAQATPTGHATAEPTGLASLGATAAGTRCSRRRTRSWRWRGVTRVRR